MKQAEISLIKYVQTIAFPEEVNDLLSHNQVSKTSSLVSLNPCLQNGVVVVGGRLVNAPVHQNVKHPAIIPGSHHLTELIVRDIHENHGHAGREYVLAETRKKYWVIGARHCIRKVLRKCITCKRREPVPCQQQMADLPADRVTPGKRVFSTIGIDLYGPMTVKRGRGTMKRYGCIFTCLVTRAIHVEIAHSLEADSFIQCLQRFVARRSKPTLIRSDNGRNLVGAERELREEAKRWNERKVYDHLLKEANDWRFNTPSASTHGGVWERMIRSLKRVIGGLCQEQVLTDEGLLTITAMAESIVNNRPITPNSSDPTDLNALTPSHFLILEPVQDLHGAFEHECLRRHWRQLQYLSQVLWRRWVREYLPQLQQRTKWVRQFRDVRVGDLVILMDTSHPKINGH